MSELSGNSAHICTGQLSASAKLRNENCFAKASMIVQCYLLIVIGLAELNISTYMSLTNNEIEYRCASDIYVNMKFLFVVAKFGRSSHMYSYF